jgi:hypothetical protein
MMMNETKGQFAPSLPANLATLRATLTREVPGCVILHEDCDLAVVPAGTAPAWVITYTEVECFGALMCRATIRRVDRKTRCVTLRASESLETFNEMQTWICGAIKSPPENERADSSERAADERAIVSVGL